MTATLETRRTVRGLRRGLGHITRPHSCDLTAAAMADVGLPADLGNLMRVGSWGWLSRSTTPNTARRWTVGRLNLQSAAAAKGQITRSDNASHWQLHRDEYLIVQRTATTVDLYDRYGNRHALPGRGQRHHQIAV